MPSLRTELPTTVPTTHGMRYARETMAQWLRTPPVSETTALAVEKRGVQAGIVISQTPAAGSKADDNSAITLYVSTGAPQ